MGPGVADIAQVIPEVRERLPDVPTPPGLEPEHARFRFFDSFTRFLKTAAQRQPLLLTLDDLHWADTPSLLLLQFLARELRNARLLVIGAYRDPVLNRQHPLLQTVGELVRTPGSQSLPLQGLSEQEVAQFIGGRGLQPAETLVSAIYKETEGNPFFLTEVVHLLASRGSQSAISSLQSATDLPIPQGVRAAIARRLQALSAEGQQVLTLAAVLGREFDVEALETVGTSLKPIPTGDRLLEVLEEAVAARLIAEVPQTVGRYSFSHALIRETLYEELPTLRRVQLHRQISEALEKLYEGKSTSPASTRSGQMLAELAYHFFQATQGTQEVDKAITYAIRAGERAMAVLAYEEAALHYERALHAFTRKEPQDALQRCELLLALGEAQKKARDSQRARETFAQVAELARTLYERYTKIWSYAVAGPA
jgi:predicted ATPase